MLIAQRLLLAGLLVLAPVQAMAQDAAPQTQGESPRATVVSFEGEPSLNALAAQGTTVVFFYAAWCPNCRATIAELNARWAEVNPDLTVVIADYDKETALKSKFGVTYQDTFVLLDAEGKSVKSWNAGGVDGLNANSAS
ncbi:MAG TPA: thioredoxin family protein [Devosia sp.]|jgi:thiol-disulfide isomerase/thioredoxin|uniref:TlpA family protein disulfide reductase n=1 Tax=Devosia sp. TaxID=1871048 RepID=UPI002F92D917